MHLIVAVRTLMSRGTVFTPLLSATSRREPFLKFFIAHLASRHRQPGIIESILRQLPLGGEWGVRRFEPQLVCQLLCVRRASYTISVGIVNQGRRGPCQDIVRVLGVPFSPAFSQVRRGPRVRRNPLASVVGRSGCRQRCRQKLVAYFRCVSRSSTVQLAWRRMERRVPGARLR